jgi:hypothetical protein
VVIASYEIKKQPIDQHLLGTMMINNEFCKTPIE